MLLKNDEPDAFADGEVRPVLQQINGRHPGARIDALTAEESDQGGQRGAELTA